MNIKSMIFSCVLCGLALAGGAVAHATTEEYRITVLIRDFATPGVAPDRGELAAEAVAAAMEESGLVRAVRPVYLPSARWDYPLDYVKLDDVQQDEEGNWGTGTVDVYGAPYLRIHYREFLPLSSNFLVEGTVSQIGKTWWVKASLFETGTRRKIKTAAAFAEGDTGLFEASRTVAGKLEPGYESRVLQHRTEEIRRRVTTGILPRQVAIKRLEEMHKRWPNAVEPAAVRLLLAANADGADPELIISWATKVNELLPSAGADGQRFLMRLGLDPYDLLAKCYEAQGKLEEAASTRRTAVSASGGFLGPRFAHWKELARLETQLGRDAKALEACYSALKLKPSDPDANLHLALLLEKLGKQAEAAHHFQVFLEHSPDSPKAGGIRAKLAKMAASAPTEP